MMKLVKLMVTACGWKTLAFAALVDAACVFWLGVYIRMVTR